MVGLPGWTEKHLFAQASIAERTEKAITLVVWMKALFLLRGKPKLPAVIHVCGNVSVTSILRQRKEKTHLFISDSYLTISGKSNNVTREACRRFASSIS